MRARVLVTPKAGILDPQGQAVERALPALGFTGVSNVHVGRLIELDVEDPAQLPEMCERLLTNPLIEDYEIVDAGADGGSEPLVKFGVVRFPGSCDEVDAQLAAERVGEAVILWHGDRTCTGSTRSSSPAASPTATTCASGAIARFAPVMESVAEFAADGGLVLGICNGFQVLCEAGLLPGALLPNTSLRFIFRQVTLDVAAAPTPRSRASACRAERCRSRSSTRPGATTRRASSTGRGHGQVLLRYAPGQNPNGSQRRHRRRRATQQGNVFGLMPHPEHAVDPLTGSTDGLSDLRVDRARRRHRVPASDVTVAGPPPRARPHRRRVRADRRGPRPRAERRPSWRCCR